MIIPPLENQEEHRIGEIVDFQPTPEGVCRNLQENNNQLHHFCQTHHHHKLTLLCSKVAFPIGWAQLQFKVTPMVGRDVDLEILYCNTIQYNHDKYWS